MSIKDKIKNFNLEMRKEDIYIINREPIIAVYDELCK